jgi:hypothetical protein
VLQAGQIVLVDTNAIIEAHRIGCWKALAGCFALHAVEKIVEETQTGFQNRRPEQQIDAAALRMSLSCIASITDEERADFNLRHRHPPLDPGERDLLIHAERIGETAWLLNSPDMAVVRFAHTVGWLDRLVSLEAMADRSGFRRREPLKDNYTEAWLAQRRTRLLLGA